METIGRRITVFASVAVMAFGGAGVAQAKHGSDDPVKEVRGGNGRAADDAKPHARRGADDAAENRRLKSCLKRARRSQSRSERRSKVARCNRVLGHHAGEDHTRRSGDDPAGDDRGGQRAPGVSDDHGGHGADDPAGHR